MKRSSLYRQLLINITLPLALGLIVLSFINYKVNEANLEENNQWQRQIILKQIKDNLDLYDNGMIMFEKNFDSRMISVSNNIINTFQHDPGFLQKADLSQIKRQFDTDSIIKDLYLINRDYTIVNTTFSKDSGLNFVKREPDVKPFFDSLFASSTCLVDRFTRERATEKFKKYCYQTFPHKDFILEMGLESKEASQYRMQLNKKVSDIKKQFPEIIQIDMMQAAVGSMDVRIYNQLFDLYDKAILEKKSKRAELETKDGKVYVDFLYLPIKSSTMFDAYIIQIISNDSEHQKLLYNEIWKSVLMFLCTLLPLTLILGYRAKRITKPIRNLSEKSKLISSGKLEQRIEIVGNNEITELSENFNHMIEQLQESYETLEAKVKDRTAEVVHQKEIIEEKHKEITDSINYAERIQRSFLATKDLLDENLGDYFVFFQPKDVVSGDFYWASKLNNGYFAYITADSTGHGVPGAIMSILNISSLEKSIETKTEPSEILNETRKTIISRLKKDGSAEGGKDGMDAALVVLNQEKTKMKYAAANNPVWIVRNGSIIELAPDKMPVGKHDKDQIPFTQHEFELHQGDLIYTLTDGMPDQFGGPKSKKYKYSQLKEFLHSIAGLSMEEQHIQLKEEFIKWKGDLEQVDDVCVVGIKV